MSQSDISSAEKERESVSEPIPIPDVLEVPEEPNDAILGERRSDNQELCDLAFSNMEQFLHRLQTYVLQTGSSILMNGTEIQFCVGADGCFVALMIFREGGAYHPASACGGESDKEYAGSWGDGVMAILSFLEEEARTTQPLPWRTEEEQRAHLSRIMACKCAIRRSETKKQGERFTCRTPLPLGDSLPEFVRAKTFFGRK